MSCVGKKYGSRQLRHSVVIKSVGTPTADGQGGYTSTPATVLSTFADVQPVSGKEVYFAQQLGIVANYTVLIRYNASVTSAMKLVWGSIDMQIRYVKNIDNGNQWMMLYCESGVAV